MCVLCASRMCVVMYRCLGDIIRKRVGSNTFLQLPMPLRDTDFGAPPFRHAFHRHVHRKAFLCWLCSPGAVGTGWSAAGDSTSAPPTYRACLWLRGETTVCGCVGGWREERGGEGDGDGRQAAAFISWKLIPPFVHLSIR